MILVPFFEIPHRNRLAKNIKSRCVQIIPRSTAQCRGTKVSRSQPRNISSVQTYSNLPVALLFINFLRLFNPIDQGRLSGLEPSLVLFTITRLNMLFKDESTPTVRMLTMLVMVCNTSNAGKTEKYW